MTSGRLSVALALDQAVDLEEVRQLRAATAQNTALSYELRTQILGFYDDAIRSLEVAKPSSSPAAAARSSFAVSAAARDSSPGSLRWSRKYTRSILGTVKTQCRKCPQEFLVAFSPDAAVEVAGHGLIRQSRQKPYWSSPRWGVRQSKGWCLRI